MSQQPPYALHPRPSRAPQHAAALDGNTLRRGRLHRAMKLLLIAIVWVTGLFIVTAAASPATASPAAWSSQPGRTAAADRRSAHRRLPGSSLSTSVRAALTPAGSPSAGQVPGRSHGPTIAPDLPRRALPSARTAPPAWLARALPRSGWPATA